jgi:hypothetical protein
MNATLLTKRPKRVPYFILVVVQTFGAAMLIWNGLPAFRQLAAHPGEQLQNSFYDYLMMLGALLIMQGAYWRRLLAVPIPFRNANMILNHLFIFFARLGFIFGSSLFSVVFFRHVPELDAGASIWLLVANGVLLVGSLFALFCYSLELERLGRAFGTVPRI